MKNIFLFVGVVVSLMSFGQDYYTKEFINTDVFVEKNMPVVRYKLQKVKLASFKKDWTNELEHHTKDDLKETEFQVTGTNIYNEEISKATYTVYSHFKSYEGGVEFIVGLKDSAHIIDLQSDKSSVEISNYLDAFVTRVYVKNLNAELNAQRGVLKKLESEAAKIGKNIKKADKQTMKLTAQIEQTEQKIIANKGQYEALLKSLQAKNTELAGTAKKSEGYDQIKKEAKGLEKNKKNLESDLLKYNEFIYDSKAQIETNNTTVVSLKESLELQNGKINDQKAVVLDVEEELYKLNRP